MRSRFLTPLAVFLAVAALGACDSRDDEFVIGGAYLGVTELGAAGPSGARRTTLEISIPSGTASGGPFSFTGFVREFEGAQQTSVTPVAGNGTYSHPRISLTIQDIPVSGTVSDDGTELRLEVEPGDFATLTRQP